MSAIGWASVRLCHLSAAACDSSYGEVKVVAHFAHVLYPPEYFATNTGPILTCGSYNLVNSQNANFAEFCDPTIDREIARAKSLQTSAPEASSRMWAKVDRDITDQAPWVSFANGVVLEVKAARVGNYEFNPQWGTLLDQLWVR
jgi:hypothetical protein